MTNNDFRMLPAGSGLVLGCVFVIWVMVAVVIVLMWMTWWPR